MKETLVPIRICKRKVLQDLQVSLNTLIRSDSYWYRFGEYAKRESLLYQKKKKKSKKELFFEFEMGRVRIRGDFNPWYCVIFFFRFLAGTPFFTITHF